MSKKYIRNTSSPGETSQQTDVFYESVIRQVGAPDTTLAGWAHSA